MFELIKCELNPFCCLQVLFTKYCLQSIVYKECLQSIVFKERFERMYIHSKQYFVNKEMRHTRKKSH